MAVLKVFLYTLWGDHSLGRLISCFSGCNIKFCIHRIIILYKSNRTPYRIERRTRKYSKSQTYNNKVIVILHILKIHILKIYIRY